MIPKKRDVLAAEDGDDDDDDDDDDVDDVVFAVVTFNAQVAKLCIARWKP